MSMDDAGRCVCFRGWPLDKSLVPLIGFCYEVYLMNAKI